jgi:hypothetical protein
VQINGIDVRHPILIFRRLTFRLRPHVRVYPLHSLIRALDTGQLTWESAGLWWSMPFAACATKFREATRRHAQNGFSDEKLRPIVS